MIEKETKEKIAGAADILGKAVLTTAGVAAKLSWKAAKLGAKTVYNNRDKIGGAVVGAGHGVKNLYRGVRGAFVSDSNIQSRMETIESQSRRYNLLAQRLREQVLADSTTKESLFDGLMTGTAVGSTYYGAYYINSDIIQAYEMAFPRLAAEQTLQETIRNASDEQVLGYVSAIKGKLFEIRYAEQLNESLASAGKEAVLAESATQPGWDIAIIDSATGEVDSVLQAKITNSVDYIQSALDRYPDIDIVTTDEVYQQAALLDLGDSVINSGISNIDLTQYVDDVFSQAGYEFDLTPSIIPYLIIGFLVARKKELTGYEKGVEFGERAAGSYVSYLIGGAVICVSGMLIPGIIASVGANILLNRGRGKLNKLEELDEFIKNNEKLLAKFVVASS